MEVVDEYGALRQLLHERCPGSTFRESDIRSLWDAGFESEVDIKAANGEYLTNILPGRQGKVVVLLRTFAQSEATTGAKPSLKKPKRSRVERLSLDMEATNIEEVKYIRELLATPLELPIRADDLVKFLSAISGPLPVLKHEVLYSVRNPELVKMYSPSEASVASHFDSTVCLFAARPNNEADSSHRLRFATGDFLEVLNNLSTTAQKLPRLETTMDSAENPCFASASSTLVPLMRPDFSLYLRDALILRWENKFDNAHFSWAEKEIIDKLKVWSPLYYGELPYMIGGCCAGEIFQWLKPSPKDCIRRSNVRREQFFWVQTLY